MNAFDQQGTTWLARIAGLVTGVVLMFNVLTPVTNSQLAVAAPTTALSTAKTKKAAVKISFILEPVDPAAEIIGAPFTIRGKVKRVSNNKAIPNAVIRIQRQSLIGPGKYSKWKTVATVKTRTNGNYTYKISKAKAADAYRAVFVGTKKLKKKTSSQDCICGG